jgi:hypothetical protein
MKDVEIPQYVQRVMAMEAEAGATRACHQGRGRTGGLQETCGSSEIDVRKPRRARIATHAGGSRSRHAEQQRYVLMTPAEFVHMSASLSQFLRGEKNTSEPAA